MARERDFDVEGAVALCNKILLMELATGVYYTHYAFMIYGHARIPIRSWFNEQATEPLAHAQEAGDPIPPLPETFVSGPDDGPKFRTPKTFQAPSM